MDKQEIMILLEEFLKVNPNPYIYRNRQVGDGDSFKGFHSDSWRVGGLRGGNCWGGVADEPVEADEEAEFTQLDSFLEEYFPNITFLQYKKLLPLVKTEEFSVGEYYGNYNDYRYSYVLFEDVAECLANLGVQAVKLE